MTELPTPSSSTPLPNSESVPTTDSKGLDKKTALKIIGWVNDQYTQCKNERWKAERQWYLNLAMYFGKQNIVVHDTPGSARQFKLVTPPAPYYRARPIINRIRPLMRTEMAKLTAQKPNAFIVPASSDDRDLYAAMAGEQIWDSLFREHKLHSIIRRSVFWASITGNGFIKCYWDEGKVDKISNQKGDICYEAITPFHLFVPDLKEVDLENQAYIIHASIRGLDELKLMYGVNVSIERADAEVLEESFLNVMGIDNKAKGKSSTTTVLEVWIKPGRVNEFPNGGIITVAGSTVLQFVEGNPYIHDQFPFMHIRHVETGKFYGDSTIVDLIPLQREYNRTRGQIIEAKNRMAKPQLAAEMGSVDPNKITSEPGQIILYRPGFSAPSPIPLQPLPSYVLEEQDRIKQDMDEVAGQHEVSRGQVPPGVTAATAISYLQEQDESKLSYTYDSIEEAVEKLGYQTLCYVKQYWDTPRQVRVVGLDGSFDVMAFQGSDLRDNTDIRVEAGSALPTSRAAKQAFIMDLMKMGFIDPNKGLEVMEIGGINKIYEQIQIDVRQAQRENLKMAQATGELLQQNYQEQLAKYLQSEEGMAKAEQGLIMQGPGGELLDISNVTMGGPPEPLKLPLLVPVNTWDDHRTHIERHNAYRKSQAFDQLSPEAKQLFEDHVNEHVRAIMVGAAGAMQIDPMALEASANPETYQELENGGAGQMMQNPGPEPMPQGSEGM